MINDNNYIIPFSNDINNLKQQINNFNNIKNQFNGSLDEYLKYQINQFPLHNLSAFTSHYYIITKDWDDLYLKLKEQLNQFENINSNNNNNNNNNNSNNNNQQPSIVFVFSGQGAQWNKQVLEVYENEKVFKDSMDEIDNIMKDKYYGYSVLEKLKSINDELDPEINTNQQITQTALLMVQTSLYRLYKYWNLIPSIIVGHSFGEVVGAYASGMLPDIETLCYVIYNRGKLQQTTFGCGKTMMWIDLGEHSFINQFSSQYPTVEIACILSPTNIVIGGETLEIENINSVLKSNGIYTKVLSIPTAFHHSCQEVLKDDILKLKFNSNPPTISHCSTVNGKFFDSNYYFNNQYMFDNLRGMAKFAYGISSIYKHVQDCNLGNSIVFVEIGPRPSLLNYIKKLIPTDSSYYSSVSLLCSIQRDKGVESLKEMINNIKSKGYNKLNNSI